MIHKAQPTVLDGHAIVKAALGESSSKLKVPDLLETVDAVTLMQLRKEMQTALWAVDGAIARDRQKNPMKVATLPAVEEFYQASALVGE